MAQVGNVVDISKEEMDKLLIHKNRKLYVEGKEIGYTIADVPLQGAFNGDDGKPKGELVVILLFQTLE